MQSSNEFWSKEVNFYAFIAVIPELMRKKLSPKLTKRTLRKRLLQFCCCCCPCCKCAPCTCKWQPNGRNCFVICKETGSSCYGRLSWSCMGTLISCNKWTSKVVSFFHQKNRRRVFSKILYKVGKRHKLWKVWVLTFSCSLHRNISLNVLGASQLMFDATAASSDKAAAQSWNLRSATQKKSLFALPSGTEGVSVQPRPFVKKSRRTSNIRL